MSFRDIGPIYCETPLIEVGASVPLEFWNTFTSVAPILFGVLAFVWLRERRVLRPELMIACALLIVVGVGSVLWHAFRTPLTLALDVMPGLLLFLLIVFLWPTYIKNRWWGYATLPTLFGLSFLLNPLTDSFERNGPPLSLFAAVLLIATALLALTWRRFGNYVALWGIVGVSFALAAAVFRTIDLSLCDSLPFGTHFLWHLCLSTGAFLILAMLGKILLMQAKELRN